MPKDTNIPSTLNVLIVLGGKGISEYDAFQIDQFILRGGKVYFCINGVDVSMSQYGMYPTPADTKLFDILASYGVTLNKDLVGDNQSYNPIRQGFSLTRYPLWLKIKSSNFNKDNIIVSEIERLNMLWASSITVDEKAQDKVKYLFKTTNDAWSQDRNYQVDISAYKYPVQDGGKQFIMAVSYDGPIKSYYAGRDIPVNETNEKEQFTGNKVVDGTGKFIVVGCEQFLQQNFASNDEFIFFMNGLDWLSKDGGLIEIRNKGKFSRPLDKIKNVNQYGVTKSFIIGFSTFVVPVFFIVIGVVLFLLRKMRDKKLYEKYSNKKE